ncbi:hypothetical protein [Moorella sp. E306M]|uniref:hypothetical protein n=1 Tax=Moorella sp. E306M TaxID=2572683 RepID=UPI0010FFC4BD|nr:hypothetical protein [Moorella sp. E306M]GEA17515.1 hypothetical protein E306M_06490 [Moorella sp. E306M]
MKHEIIREPKFYGCATCGTLPKVRLPKNTQLGVGFGSIELEADGQIVWYTISEQHGDKTVRWLERKFKKILQSAECVTLKFDCPLHDETYEYNKEDGQWYLIAQGPGFA